MKLRHTLLIAKYSARHSVRGGIGLVFLLLSISFGLLVAHGTIQAWEGGRRFVTESSGAPPAQRDVVLRHASETFSQIVAWFLKGSDTPESNAEARRWASYLLEDRPAILSAIFLILLFGWPFVVSCGAFDLYSSDIGSRQLRYQLLRTDRSSIFFGRLLGMTFTFVTVLVLLGATITTYIVFKVPSYAAGDLVAWSVCGIAALLVVSLPYIALCAWISALCRSAFASLTLISIVIGGIPAIALFAQSRLEVGRYVNYLLPWGFQTRLLHPDLDQFALAAGGCILQTVIFLWLGHRKFTRRDL